MKKIIFLALFLMFVTTIFAQQAKFVEISSEFMVAEFVNVEPVLSPSTSSAAASVTPFWSSDFSDPTLWSIDNDGQTNEGWNIDAVEDSWYGPLSNFSLLVYLLTEKNLEISNSLSVVNSLLISSVLFFDPFILKYNNGL